MSGIAYDRHARWWAKWRGVEATCEQIEKALASPSEPHAYGSSRLTELVAKILRARSEPPAGTLRDGEQQMWAIRSTDGPIRCVSVSRTNIGVLPLHPDEQIVPVAVRFLSPTEPTTAGTNDTKKTESQ